MSVRHRLTLLIGSLILAVVALYSASAYAAIRSSAMADAGGRAERIAAQFGRLLAVSAQRQRSQAASLARRERVVSFLTAGSPDPNVLDELTAQTADSAPLEILGPDGEPRTGRPAALGSAPLGVEAALVSLSVAAGAAASGALIATDSGVFIPTIAPVRGPEAAPPIGYLVRWIRIDDDTTTRTALEGLVGEGSLFYLTNDSGDVWTDFAGRIDDAPQFDADSSLTHVVTFAGASGRWIGASAVVEETPWRTLVAFPMGAVLAPARHALRRLTLFGSLLLAVGLVAALALAAGLTRPLQELAEAAGALGRGEYERRVTEPGMAELRTVARTFNAMAGRIRDAHAELEQKVRDTEISERRRRAAQERLEQVTASTNAVIYERGAGSDEARLTWVSDNVERVLGYTPEAAQAERWWRTYVHPDDLAELEEWVAAPRAGATSRTYRFMNGEGEYRWLRDERRCVADDEGLVALVVGAWLDVTEQQVLELQLRQAQKLEAVGRLAGGVAHDFNNILTVILAETEDAKVHVGADPAAVRASLDAVLGAASSAAMLTRQLLTFSRKELVDFQPLRVNEVVEALHSMLVRLVGEDVSLRQELAPDLWRVTADRGHVEQVLANLVVNARDATKPGGSIVIRTENVTLDEAYASSHAGGAIGDHVVIAVSDTGVGMTEEVKAHLFEPFFTTKPVGQGTGLGLATCYTIAERLGGHIRIYSELGVGTTVRLYLPRTRRLASEEPTAPTAGPFPGGDETVLVVEDDPSVRRVAARVLRGRGYDVLEAENGVAALALIEGGAEPDLVLTDLVMPHMGGRDLAKRVRSLRPAIRVLFMSGYTDDVVIRRDLVEHGIPFIHKPFNIAALAGKVREVLDAP